MENITDANPAADTVVEENTIATNAADAAPAKAAPTLAEREAKLAAREAELAALEAMLAEKKAKVEEAKAKTDGGSAPTKKAAPTAAATLDSPEAAKTEKNDSPKADAKSETKKADDGAVKFSDLELPEAILKAVTDSGYTEPSPIQAQSIPALLAGNDILGQAKTGTGKTAAFSLPLLAQIDPSKEYPQAIILAPTRELALQVSESMQKYARHVRGLRIISIYGGQPMMPQLKALKRGAHVVVGTPGRTLDHLRRGSLKLGKVRHLVLDEADEMLRMGFIEDVETVLQETPDDKQVALFSATMPEPIRRIAHKYLSDPVEVRIKSSTSTAQLIDQKFAMVKRMTKKEALLRLLETNDRDASLIFVRTKLATVEIATELQKHGHRAIALNGDMKQNERARAVEMLKKGGIDIVVATDVAARGLDVERISHVFNFDPPFDNETYVHRIGRTGRAGREGTAIMLVTARDMRIVRSIERHTRQRMDELRMPSPKDITEGRIARFKQNIAKQIEQKDDPFYSTIIDSLLESDIDARALCIALVKEVAAKNPLRYGNGRDDKSSSSNESSGRGRDLHEDTAAYSIDVGRDHGVATGQIVGAIANEANIPGSKIGPIRILAKNTIVGLPADLDENLLNVLRNVFVAGRKLAIRKHDGPMPERTERRFGKDDRDGDRRFGRKPFNKKGKFGGKFGKKGGKGKPHRKGQRFS